MARFNSNWLLFVAPLDRVFPKICFSIGPKGFNYDLLYYICFDIREGPKFIFEPIHEAIQVRKYRFLQRKFENKSHVFRFFLIHFDYIILFVVNVLLNMFFDTFDGIRNYVSLDTIRLGFGLLYLKYLFQIFRKLSLVYSAA